MQKLQKIYFTLLTIIQMRGRINIVGENYE